MVSTAVGLTEDDARAIVGLAVLAPSIHNTQPWRWRLDEAGLHLYADPTRQLAVADPSGRQLLISCGAALTFARLAVRSRGLEPAVELGPLDEDAAPPAADTPLATITVTGRRPADDHESALVAAISSRHTDRRPFLAGERGRLGPDDLAALRRAAEADSAWASFVDDTDTRIETSVLLARADWHESHDPAYAEELRRWRRGSAATGATAGGTPAGETPAGETPAGGGPVDGVSVAGAPSDGLPDDAVTGLGEGRQSEFVLRDFDPGHVVGPSGPGGAGVGPVERPTVVVIGTDSDRPVDWLLAGGATGRVMLTATVCGLAVSPLGQVIDLTASREQLSSVIGSAGHVQMLLRVGRPDPDLEPLPATPRRRVEDVLEIG